MTCHDKCICGHIREEFWFSQVHLSQWNRKLLTGQSRSKCLCQGRTMPQDDAALHQCFDAPFCDLKDGRPSKRLIRKRQSHGNLQQAA